MNTETLELKIKQLEDRVDYINKTCCSNTNMEQRIKTNMLLESLSKKIDMIVQKQDETEDTLNEHKKYIHYVIGAFFIFQILSSGEAIHYIASKL